MKSIIDAINNVRQQNRQRFLQLENNEHETVSQWQATFLADVLLILMPLSVVIYIPSLWLSLKEGLTVVAIVDTIAVLILQLIYFHKTMAIKTRKQFLLLSLFFLEVVLLYYLGWSGPGLVYLIGFSAFSTLIYSKKAGYVTLFINILMLLILAIISALTFSSDPMVNNMSPEAIITVGLNFIILNLILVTSISSLTKGLHRKIESEKEIKKKLLNEMILHQKAREHAEKSDKLKSAFLANMSHEIRTPMNGILGFVELLKSRELSGDKQQEYIEIIETSGERLLTLLNNLIDISKIEAGLMELHLSETNINEVLDFTYAFFKPMMEKKQLQFKLEQKLDVKDSIVITDMEKIYAIFTNLVKNAFKYTHNGEIKFGCIRKDNQLMIYVKDTGIGVSENRLEAIFERFIQADIADRGNYQGAGLGLSITKAYVELLGGKIEVRSRENQGSEFIVHVPFKQNS